MKSWCDSGQQAIIFCSCCYADSNIQAFTLFLLHSDACLVLATLGRFAFVHHQDHCNCNHRPLAAFLPPACCSCTFKTLTLWQNGQASTCIKTLGEKLALNHVPFEPQVNVGHYPSRYKEDHHHDS